MRSTKSAVSHARSVVQPAVFLDRDGTLIHDRGWLREVSDVAFYDDTVDALRRLQSVARLFIVTNQGGISRGFLTRKEADTVNRFVVDSLAAHGVRIEAVYTCQHHRDDGCDCIKPNPFFAMQAAMDFNIAPSRSFALGDHPHDVDFARRFGGKGIYLLTGHGQHHVASLTKGQADAVAPTLSAAVDHVLASVSAVPSLMVGVEEAARLVAQGEVVAIPTETVYGLASNALDVDAVRHIFKIKQRPPQDPLIVHVADVEACDAVASYVPDAARKLAEMFWSGPLTLVLPKRSCVPDVVTSGLGTVAVRVPAHPVARAVIRQAGCPVAAPSANRFGAISPTCADHVISAFANEGLKVVDGGQCRVGVESTILGFWENRIWLLRPGGIPVEALEACVGKIESYRQKNVSDIRAPGSMPRHYAPATPLLLNDGHGVDDESNAPLRTGRLVYGPDAPLSGLYVENVSPSGDLEEAAANLYAALRRLDHEGLDRIVADRFPDKGLGRTINDRLERASKKAE